MNNFELFGVVSLVVVLAFFIPSEIRRFKNKSHHKNSTPHH